MLYGDSDFPLCVERDGGVEFLGKHILRDGVGDFDFSALNQIHKLHIVVASGKGHQICDVQDTLFKILKHLHEKHKLHESHVSIRIDGDQDRAYALFNINYAERMYPVDAMREFRDIAPGDLSRLPCCIPHRSSS